ncbi:MAG TPA: hypothetical protein VHW67_00535 [Solirubrobacteraceae bacterium]|nr:hypothetical protein [Solirubrobacteraceae bacterium]
MISKAGKLIASNAVGLLALFVALGGVGYAATGGFASNGKLQGCAAGNGTLTLLKPGKKCRKGQTAVAWSMTGPNGGAGAQGPAGAPGAAGAAGPKGPAGTDGEDAAEGSEIKWARIERDGIIESGVGITEVKGVKSPYEPVFDRDIRECAVTATSNEAFVSDKVTSVDPEKPNSVHVFIRNSEEKEVSADFSIVVICP